MIKEIKTDIVFDMTYNIKLYILEISANELEEYKELTNTYCIINGEKMYINNVAPFTKAFNQSEHVIHIGIVVENIGVNK